MGILTNEVKEFVKREKLGFVATVCADGTPNLSPKGTTNVWDDDHLMFADIYSPGTVKNLLVNAAVEVNVVDVFLRKGYRFKGTGTVLSSGPLFEDIASFYQNAGASYSIKHIVLIKVEQVLPLESPIYNTGLSEAEVRNKWIEYWSAIHPAKK